MILLASALFAAFGGMSALTWALLLPSVYLLDTGLLWYAFLAVMRLQEVRDAGRFPSGALRIGYAALYVGLLIDAAYNLTWATVIFLDPPREWLVTQRLKRYKFGDDGRATVDGWRLARTYWYCDNMLDPFDPDPGGHVRP